MSRRSSFGSLLTSYGLFGGEGQVTLQLLAVLAVDARAIARFQELPPALNALGFYIRINDYESLEVSSTLEVLSDLFSSLLVASLAFARRRQR